MGQIYSELVIPASKFDPSRDVPDLSGKVIIVTGGNTGIGKETIKFLLQKEAKVYMASRSRLKAEQAITELHATTGRTAIFLQLDLANLDSVTRAAREFQSREPALHILFNSAGVMAAPHDQLTADGYDLQFGTNVLGPAHLTLMLMDQLIAGARSSVDGHARVVHTSSIAAYFSPSRLDYRKVMGGTPERQKTFSYDFYLLSKLANIRFSNELARRYGKDGILSNAVNPGNLDTELQRHISSFESWCLSWIVYPPSFGALTQLYAGTSPETVNDNGSWFIPWARRGKAATAAADPTECAKLWEWIEEQRKSHK